jgi:hypothetical protein
MHALTQEGAALSTETRASQHAPDDACWLYMRLLEGLLLAREMLHYLRQGFIDSTVNRVERELLIHQD